MNVDPLFRPFPFGKRMLRNRVVMAPMTRSRSPGGVPGDLSVAYYARRAAHGTALVISEGTIVDHPGANGYPDVPYFFGDEALAGWRRVADAVHAAGGAFAPQLWHVGSVRQSAMGPTPGVSGYGPSAVLSPGNAREGKTELPREMTQHDIDEVVASFARGAADARRIGCDGVEIHGAHGYLIDQFNWPATNRRTDGYGGTLENRTRFAREIVAAVRAAVGPDFPVILRFSQWKMGDYHARIAATPEELGRWLCPLADAGVDIFHASTRRFWEPEFEGSDLNLAGWAKKLTDKPTITVGSVGLDADLISTWKGLPAKASPLDNLLERLARDEFDLVAVGRALLANPDWAEKIREGRDADLQPFTAAALAELF